LIVFHIGKEPWESAKAQLATAIVPQCYQEARKIDVRTRCSALRRRGIGEFDSDC
jgi:hypothetical protein